MKDVTVVIPTIQGRGHDLSRAIHSVQEQSVGFLNLDLHIISDVDGLGPAVMRNVGVDHADTEWIAFLDDDDYLYPNHLEVLLRAAETTEADVLWPWFFVEGGTDPFPQYRGRQWDPDHPHSIPITTLVRRSVFNSVGGFTPVSEAVPDPNDPDRTVSGEDFRLWCDLSAAGAKFFHVDEVTWVWRHHAKNTSGLPDRARELYS